MANASRDENRVTTLIGTLNTDGATVIPVKADSSSHGVEISDGNSGTDHGTHDAIRDANHVPVLLAVSSDDGVTTVPVYADVDGNLMINSN